MWVCSHSMSLHYIEIQPRIQAAHLLLSGDIPAISVSCNSISHTATFSGENDEAAIYKGDSPNLTLSKQPSIEIIPQVGLSMRFRAPRDFIAENILAQNAFSGSGREVPNNFVIRCRFCKIPLTKTNNLFKRVLPLPSDAWYGFDAYCHGNHTPTQLTPQQGDLLTGDSVLLVDGTSLCSERLLISDEGGGTVQVTCKRCRSVCGTILDSKDTLDGIAGASIELQRSKVLDPSDEERIACLWNKRCQYFAQRLQTFSNSRTAFRFKVVDQNGRPYLSVWLMNTVSRVICSDFEHLRAVLLRFTDCSPEGGRPSIDGYALRVMFKPHLNEDSVPDVRADEEMLKLDSEECLELLLLLAHSNLVVPPSRRTASGYKIGLLMVPPAHAQ